MKYYTIDNQVETEQTGKVYPQLEILRGGNHNDPQSIMTLSRKQNLKQTNTVFSLCKKANLTDFISWGSLQYPVISEKLKDFLLKFELFETEFIPVEIEHYQSKRWYVMNPRHSNSALSLIDFEKSIFGELDPDSRKIVRKFKFPHDVKDVIQQWRDERKNFHEDFHELVICELYFSENGIEHDFIPIFPLLDVPGVVISERLKKGLESELFTGIEILEFEWGRSSLN